MSSKIPTITYNWVSSKIPTLTCNWVSSKISTQDDNVWQELYQDITNLAEKQNVLPSKPRTAGRQQHRDNVPADTPEEYWRRSVYYSLLDHIANELETRLVVPKVRFLAQYLIPSKLVSLTPKRELQVFMPLPHNNFSAYKAEKVRWKCKWQNVTEKPSTLIDTLKHAKPELYSNIHRAVKVLLTHSQKGGKF